MPNSKTPNGIAEVPLTSFAIEAFKSQMAISGEGPFLFPSGHQTTFKTFGGKLFDGQRFLTFGITTFVPRMPLG
jgi:hypothetical protein